MKYLTLIFIGTFLFEYAYGGEFTLRSGVSGYSSVSKFTSIGTRDSNGWQYFNALTTNQKFLLKDYHRYAIHCDLKKVMVAYGKKRDVGGKMAAGKHAWKESANDENARAILAKACGN